MTFRACPICAHALAHSIGDIGHRSLARCCSCGHRYAAHFCVDELEREYRAAYYADPSDPRITAWADAHRVVWDAIVSQLERLHPSAARFLDVGSGSGGFLARLRARHPDAELAAVEPAEAARVALLARMPDVAFVARQAEELAGVARRFDVVTMLQTLEHLADPLAALRGARRCLAPGGVLFVTVPNRRSLAVLRAGRGADCYANGTHLQFFDRTRLFAVLRRAGFGRPERIVHFGGGQQLGWLGAAAQYLTRRLGLSTELRVAARTPGADR